MLSPYGRYLYTVGEEEARYLVRSGQGKLHSSKSSVCIRLRLIELPSWVYGTRYHYRQDLPDSDHKTCSCWALRPLDPRDGDLFRLSQGDCMNTANRCKGKGKGGGKKK